MNNDKVGLSIVGSSRINGTRGKDDFYPTPQWVTKSLLDRENFYGLTREVACGADFLRSRSYALPAYGITDLFEAGLAIKK